MSYRTKVESPAPHKLLACDGGGIRGIISVEILAKIEAELRAVSGKPESRSRRLFRLRRRDKHWRDHRDARRAADSASIRSASSTSRAARRCSRRRAYGSASKRNFKDDKLAAMIQADPRRRDYAFGSDNLRTLLMIVLRNATTDSPWPLSNNPKAKYNLTREPPAATPSSSSGSSSAPAPPRRPTFRPKLFTSASKEFIFVDGGVTMYNNPAFQLFLMATTEPYRLCWQTGEDKMLLVSVGTGASANANANFSPEEMNLLYNAGTIPSALMAAALQEQDLLCRVFGRCLAGDIARSRNRQHDRSGNPRCAEALHLRPLQRRAIARRTRRARTSADQAGVRAADGFRRAHFRNAGSRARRGENSLEDALRWVPVGLTLARLPGAPLLEERAD